MLPVARTGLEPGEDRIELDGLIESKLFSRSRRRATSARFSRDLQARAPVH
jgi:hypothetical protein